MTQSSRVTSPPSQEHSPPRTYTSPHHEPRSVATGIHHFEHIAGAYPGVIVVDPSMVPPGYVIGQMAAPRAEEPEEPLYVNAKQYHRILKRRAARANLEAQNRQSQRGRKFMHESRHLHAMRRPRGPGGRFLTAAEIAALEAQGELNNSSKSNGSQSTGGSKDGANGNGGSSHDKTSNTGRNHSNNHNGHYFPAKTAAPSHPANGFKAMPPADGQRVVSSYQA